MKRIFLICVLILINSIVLNATEYNYKGSFVLKNNKIIVAPLFDMNCDSFKVELPEYNNQITYIKVSKIKKIIFPIPTNPNKAIIFLKDGKKFKIKLHKGSYCFCWHNGYRYKAVDPISGKLMSQSVYYAHVKEIVFDADWGDVRIDANNNVFPPDYIYSPYTGEQMRLIKLTDIPK